MLSAMTDIATDLTDLLRARTRGQVLLPADSGYDAARSPFNAMASGRPAAIVRPVDSEDVAAAIRAGVEADLGIGVRCGGHSVAGHSAPNGGLLIDLSSWRGADVDPVTKTADALGGSRLMDLDAATAAFGLAAPSGTFVDTGITGLTLSGGISYLLPSEGFACDALVGAQVVTASGDVVETDEQRQPELLWALRGGGGNFGVVTRLRYRLTEVPTIYGGNLRYRGDGLLELLERVFELRRQAPDELSLQALTWPSEDDGAGVTIMVAWRGDPESGDREIAGLLEHPGLYERNLRPMTWLQMQARNTPMPFGLRHYWKGHFVLDTPTELAAAMLEAGRRATGSDFILGELIHGRAHRIPAESAAFGGRRAAANVTAIAVWTDPAEDDAHVAWARSTAAAVEPWSMRGGGYLNYVETDVSAARVAAAFEPATFARLRQVKRRYDPENRFRFNGNIPPA
jgi:FAD/FMN-containing dehydrogenase